MELELLCCCWRWELFWFEDCRKFKILRIWSIHYHFSYMHYGLGFRHWLHTFVPYLEYVVKCRMVFKNPRIGHVCPVEENVQKYSKRFKEHSVLQGFILNWNYLEWQISDRLEKKWFISVLKLLLRGKLKTCCVLWTTLGKGQSN
jgi:hypothetical protein